VLSRAKKLEQESLADAKVRARQQCAHERPIAKKSTANQPYEISNFPFTFTVTTTVITLFAR